MGTKAAGASQAPGPGRSWGSMRLPNSMALLSVLTPQVPPRAAEERGRRARSASLSFLLRTRTLRKRKTGSCPRARRRRGPSGRGTAAAPSGRRARPRRRRAQSSRAARCTSSNPPSTWSATWAVRSAPASPPACSSPRPRSRLGSRTAATSGSGSSPPSWRRPTWRTRRRRLWWACRWCSGTVRCCACQCRARSPSPRRSTTRAATSRPYLSTTSTTSSTTDSGPPAPRRAPSRPLPARLARAAPAPPLPTPEQAARFQKYYEIHHVYSLSLIYGFCPTLVWLFLVFIGILPARSFALYPPPTPKQTNTFSKPFWRGRSRMVVGQGVSVRSTLAGRTKKKKKIRKKPPHQTRYIPIPVNIPVYMYTHTRPAKPVLGGFEQWSQRLFSFPLSRGWIGAKGG